MVEFLCKTKHLPHGRDRTGLPGIQRLVKDGRAFTFRPLVNRDDLLGAELDGLAERICEGQSMPLLLNLVHSERLSPADIHRLRNLIDELDDGNRS